MKFRSLTSDKNTATITTLPANISNKSSSQFCDAQFKLSNFVVNKSPFQSTYDGILEFEKMIQGYAPTYVA